MSPTHQDLSNDTTFSQIKSRVPVPLSTTHPSIFNPQPQSGLRPTTTSWCFLFSFYARRGPCETSCTYTVQSASKIMQHKDWQGVYFAVVNCIAIEQLIQSVRAESHASTTAAPVCTGRKSCQYNCCPHRLWISCLVQWPVDYSKKNTLPIFIKFNLWPASSCTVQ